MATFYPILKKINLILFVGVLINSLDIRATQAQSKDFQSLKPCGLDAAAVYEGWLSLFDGESMTGWRDESGGRWRVKDGMLVAKGKVNELLRTAVQFDDFELRLDFKCEPESQCEFYVRTSPDPKANPRNYCSCQFTENPKTTGEWNRLRMVADGSGVTAWLNGNQQELFGDVKALRKGYLGIGLRSGSIEISKALVKPLKLKALLTHELNMWNLDNKLESSFDVVGNVLRMKGGRGQIETNQQFGDFVFSIQAKTNSAGLNSGVFFRCIPNELMNGYESQIQNQFNGDRTQPVDCGTGGIFRRQDASFLNADDNVWFAKTILADGATICVWVNGLLITDWTDKRKKNQNPRKGLRLNPGTIILQGHDPTTDLSFKNLMVRELNQRRD